ncbi:hypothetical protein D3C76_1839370 [compost metagenome]
MSTIQRWARLASCRLLAGMLNSKRKYSISRSSLRRLFNCEWLSNSVVPPKLRQIRSRRK